MNIKIKKIRDNAILPSYAHLGDAGMDVFSVVEKDIQPGEVALIPIGYAVEIPDGYEIQIRPKSGLALKYGITILNTPGTIDSGYRGEICAIVINHGKKIFHVAEGMKIAQMVLCKYEKICFVESSVLMESERNDGGFGSTGV